MVIDKSRYRFIVFISFVVLIVLIAFAAAIGTVKISVLDVLKTVLSRFKIINENEFLKTNEIIIFNIRLPRAFLACFIGMGLSMVGLVYQGIFKNPMADPFVLGTSSGSALGASIAIVLGIEKTFLGLSSIAACAFTGAVLTTLVVYNIAKVGNRASNTNLLLSGVAMNFFLSSIISFIMVLDRNQVEKIVFWTLGSLAGANYKNVMLLILIVIPSSFIIYFFYRDLNIIATGEETASSLGVEVEKVKNLMFIISSLIVATCVSVSGIIGFVGLIMPHIVKIIIGPDYKKALPLTLLWGAIFMVLCDILSRSILSPAEIPIGVITSFFGAPYFIYLLYKDKKKVIS
ncbi:MAG: iron ABC transporter permease [Caloramator sp.]|nr:iron ABC transporter permease [Caloramator sp.]